MTTPASPRIIGGMFGLDPLLHAVGGQVSFMAPGSLLLLNARSGIQVLIEKLRPARVWMPSYLCGSMLEGCPGVQVCFYPIDANLGFAQDPGFRSGDLVVVVDYFGFAASVELVVTAKASGAWILEDACQALLSSHVGRNADFVLFSPRKFLGVPDGGILRSNIDLHFDDVRLAPAPSEWTLKSWEAVISRREFDLFGGQRRWFELFNELESTCPVGHFAMSAFSETLLRTGFNYADIANRRRENFSALLALLSEIALFPELPDHVVPLGFPIRLEHRDRVRHALFAEQIYPPIHWPIGGIVPECFEASHRLSREILTLPCDQRCTPDDMDRVAAVLRFALTS